LTAPQLQQLRWIRAVQMLRLDDQELIDSLTA
jgi:hypothetical protein